MMRKIYIPYIIFALIILLIPVFIHSYYYLGVLIQAGYFSLICMGLSLVMGYAGQISLGHAAFFGLGGYASAILTGGHGWCPWLAMIVARIISGVLAWLIGKPSSKLKGPYLAMATLALNEIVVTLITVSYTHLRAHETVLDLVCRLLLEKKKTQANKHYSPIQSKQHNTID